MNPPPLQVGDFAPAAILQDQHGEAMAFHHQQVAGHPVVVLICRDARATDGLRHLRDLHAEFTAADARVLAVTPLGTAENRALVESQRLPFSVLADPRNEVLGRFADAAVAVLDRNQRVAGLFSGDAAAAALTLCRRLNDDDTPAAASPHAPVLQVPDIFEPELCRRLIDYWQSGDKRANEVTRGTPGQADYAARSDGAVKRRTDVLVPEDNNPTNLAIRDRLLARVVPEVFKAFQFRVRSYEVARIGCYDATDGGWFRPHRDDAGDPAKPRRFALSVNLNDDFDGGGLCFPEYGRRFYRPAAGGGVAFSCNLLHEAQPVTHGRRFGLFTFLR